MMRRLILVIVIVAVVVPLMGCSSGGIHVKGENGDATLYPHDRMDQLDDGSVVYVDASFKPVSAFGTNGRFGESLTVLLTQNRAYEDGATLLGMTDDGRYVFAIGDYAGSGY